jgi:type IV secretion system protein TrbL
MVTYALIGGGWSLTNTWVSTAAYAAQNTASVETAWALAAGALLYALVCWFSARMVSSLLTGAPAFSGGEALTFIAPMVSAGVSAGLIASGLVTGGTTAAAGAAGIATSAGGAVSSGASAAASGPTPASAPPSSGLQTAGAAASAGLKALSAGARAMQSMPHGGNHSAPPSFDGFRH